MWTKCFVFLCFHAHFTLTADNVSLQGRQKPLKVRVLVELSPDERGGRTYYVGSKVRKANLMQNNDDNME